MTEAAQRFVGSTTFAALSHNPVTTSLWDQNSEISIDHVALGVKAHCIVIAPATANILAKLALGITDDPVTATVLASNAPQVIAPAMDADMFASEVHTNQRPDAPKTRAHSSSALKQEDWHQDSSVKAE